MAKRAPLKATFHAFARRPGAVLRRALLAHCTLVMAVLVGAGGLFLHAMASALRQTGDAEIWAAWLPIGLLAAAFIYCVIAASFEAACLRWLVRNETKGFMGFSLGGDTWRVYFGYWIWGLVFAAVVGIAYWVMFRINEALDRISADEITQMFALLGAFAAVIFGLIAAIGPSLSAGNAASVARRRFSFFKAMSVRRGRAFSLLGSLSIVLVISMVIAAALFLAMSVAIFLIVNRGSWVERADSDANSYNLMMTIALIAVFIIGNWVFMFLAAGVNARAALDAIDDGRLDGVTPAVANNQLAARFFTAARSCSRVALVEADVFRQVSANPGHQCGV